MGNYKMWPRQEHGVVKKWVKDKRNASVVKRINNQAHALEPTHEQRRAHTIYEGMSIKRKANSYSCR